jgi:putative ABC transport system permease protein
MEYVESIWIAVQNFFASYGLRIEQWAVAYAVLIVPVLVSLRFRLGIHGSILLVSLRAMGQLLLIALLLIPIFQGHFLLQMGLVLVMMVLGAMIAMERGKGLPGVFFTSLLAISGSTLVVLGFFWVAGALPRLVYILVPLAGMLIGNCSRSVALLYERCHKDFLVHQSIIEAFLLDGLSSREALRLPMTETLRTALAPMVDSLKTLGIVHIPGAMAGMMVAGASPLEAAGYQILIFLGIMAASTLAIIMANERTYRQLFVKYYPHLTAKAI